MLKKVAVNKTTVFFTAGPGWKQLGFPLFFSNET
jgi:hypothetical protein